MQIDSFFKILIHMLKREVEPIGKEPEAFLQQGPDDHEIILTVSLGKRTYAESFNRNLLIFAPEKELQSMACGFVLRAAAYLIVTKRPHAAKYLYRQPLGPKRLRE